MLLSRKAGKIMSVYFKEDLDMSFAKSLSYPKKMTFTRNVLKNNEIIGIFSRDSKGIIRNIQTNEIILGTEDDKPKLIEVITHESEGIKLQFLMVDSSKIFAGRQQIDIKNRSCELPKAFHDFYSIIGLDEYYYIIFDLDNEYLYGPYSCIDHCRQFAMFAISKNGDTAKMVIEFDEFYKSNIKIYLVNNRIIAKYSCDRGERYSEIVGQEEVELQYYTFLDLIH
jgi:hypothetical protein